LKTLALLLTVIGLNAHAAAETPALSFKAALAAMQERNLDIQTQKATLSQAEALRLGSAAAFLPSLQMQASETQVQGPFTRVQRGALVGQINLFHSGTDLAAWRAQQAAVRRERYQLTQTEIESEQIHIAALVRYIQYAQQLQLAEKLSRLNRELAVVVDARFKRGMIPLQDAQKALVEKNNSQSREEDARVRLENARAELANLLGLSDVSPVWPWKPLLTPEAAVKFVGQIKLQLEKTPAWQTAIEDLRAQDQFERSRFRNFLPSLDLTVDYGYSDFLNDKRPDVQTTLLLTIPLIDLKKHSDYRIRVQETALAEIRKEKMRRTLLSSWDEIRQKLTITLRSARQREESVTMAKSLYEDNERRARAGRSSLNDILVDQNRLSEAENLAIEGWAQAHLLYAQLCHVQGLRMNQERFGCD